MKGILRTHSFPIAPEGLPYILAGLLLAASSISIWHGSLLIEHAAPWLAVFGAIMFALFTGFSLWFYRNPKRNTPQNEKSVVFSPADGRVLKIEDTQGSRIGEPSAKKISIFMSPIDVHVNRAPVAGIIESIKYTPGKFFKADLDKASEENEHNWIVVKSELGPRIAFVQIAGFIARRIVCYVNPGERLKCGERFGMIRFGSRMEIIFPANFDVLVQVGQKTSAGLTRLACLTKT